MKCSVHCIPPVFHSDSTFRCLAIGLHNFPSGKNYFSSRNSFAVKTEFPRRLGSHHQIEWCSLSVTHATENCRTPISSFCMLPDWLENFYFIHVLRLAELWRRRHTRCHTFINFSCNRVKGKPKDDGNYFFSHVRHTVCGTWSTKAHCSCCVIAMSQAIAICQRVWHIPMTTCWQQHYWSHAKLSNGRAWTMQLFFLTTLVCTVLQNELIHNACILQAGLIHIVNYEMLIFPLTAALNICLVCPRKRYYSHYLVFEHLWLKVLWPPFGMSQRCTMARSCMALCFL